MLVIRLSRTGKKHQPYFRVIVSDKRKSPTAKFVEIIGNYDPHSKKFTVNKEKLELYMKNGAQPSNSLAKLLKAEKINLPKWVKITEKKKVKKEKKKPGETSAPAPKAEAQEASKNEDQAPEAEATPDKPVDTEDAAEIPEETKVESKPEEPSKEVAEDEDKEEPSNK